ncbi:hypothetical protein [Halorhabdus sp. SVX81]|uniref:hypothetical protein n=1 Tax=Halorhabdus sp. SVX81 TaxID=2978283 RepID=UPI0023DCB960|nr:hypothetical protein [Halorhabdus sp. SVX81]
MDISSKAALGGGLLVVVFVLFAGLIGVPFLNDNSCPPQLHVSEDRSGANGVEVEYEDLSERRQTEFRDALRNDFTNIDTTYDAWVSTSLVKYHGENYSIAVAVC